MDIFKLKLKIFLYDNKHTTMFPRIIENTYWGIFLKEAPYSDFTKAEICIDDTRVIVGDEIIEVMSIKKFELESPIAITKLFKEKATIAIVTEALLT